jgi:threonine dehydrogenase-like Zn-dependent dehydrogenase
MRAAAIAERGRLELQEVPDPEPGPYQALARILACASCSATDLKIIDGEFGPADYPVILGHESIGEVVEVGKRVTSLKVGDHVLRPCAAYPGETLGEYSSGWGGFAEIGIVTDCQAALDDGLQPPSYAAFQQVVPAEISPSDATMLITLKETLSWLQELDLKPGDNLLVIGDGSVGLTFTHWAKVLGASMVAVAGHHDQRLERALKVGADLTVNTRSQDLGEAVRPASGAAKFQVVIDCVGGSEALHQAMRHVAPGGTVSPYGTQPTQRYPVNFGLGGGDYKIQFAYGGEGRVHGQILDAVRMGLVELSDYYSHELSFENVVEGFEMLRSREALKVVVTF